MQRGELRDDVAALAAPIVDTEGIPVAAVGLFLPIVRLTEVKEGQYAGLVVEAAAEISTRLGVWRSSRAG